MGIPYAEPPVEDLRFRAPVEVKPWQGILKAQQEPPMCIQLDPFIHSRKVYGQEDCLYLNVYAPEVPITRILLMKNVYEAFYLLEEK